MLVKIIYTNLHHQQCYLAALVTVTLKTRPVKHLIRYSACYCMIPKVFCFFFSPHQASSNDFTLQSVLRVMQLQLPLAADTAKKIYIYRDTVTLQLKIYCTVIMDSRFCCYSFQQIYYT
jgi:hypothetical protein